MTATEAVESKGSFSFTMPGGSVVMTIKGYGYKCI
jgi:hypothetical protein